MTNCHVYETKGHDRTTESTPPHPRASLIRECASSISTTKLPGDRLGDAQLSKPGARGYSLREVLKWEQCLYHAVQPQDICMLVKTVAQHNFPLLKWYQDAWPAADLATIFLKNTSSERWQKVGMDPVCHSPFTKGLNTGTMGHTWHGSD
ncbi:hypothetical protein EDC04DRAFT_2603272 [Pisolithus marmoratus]|nr:hypothetical protein EDC04DRAFT_2603272 [Pisolithus marmoratus]